ncbi:hypothetical protein M436DRAFT_85976 [Aureobasidium namibiae CBS 147.97]|uniref:F-box domain-containing protein n=1 Tax=Aureobasidium namibiae CBS 147.97 TaxID=1043004 RepID=A0A074WG19_9PEZI
MATTSVIPTAMELLLDTVPDEIWEKILAHFIRDRDTLQAVIGAACSAHDQAPRLHWQIAHDQALRLYWQNETCEKELLEELEDHQPNTQQQSLADLMRNVVTDFKAPHAHHEARGLQFPRLQSLTVQHGKAELRGETRTFARVARFVRDRLRHLEIGDSLDGRPGLLPIVDNFLPKLSKCKGLRLLKLYARLTRRTTSEDLVAVLQRCTRLETLHLESLVDDLINESVMGCIALHPAIEELELEKRFDQPFALSIVAVAHPFQKLRHLVLFADAAAANILLPCITQLERLELTVDGTASVFPYLRGLKNLWSIWLKFTHYTLSDNDLAYLVLLKRLKYLELTSTHDGERLDATLLNADPFATVLGSLPALVSRNLNATNNLGDPFLLALGRQCRILRDLTLTGTFTLEPLATEPTVLFPCLLSLRLGSLSPSVPIRQLSFFREFWADQRAQDVLRHAPLVSWFDCCQDDDDVYGKLAEEAWKKLKSDGDVYVGG